MPKFQPGNKFGKGRPPGPNKTTTEVKEAIIKAFQELGGVEYLKEVGRKKPDVFCALFGKIIPKNVNVSGADGEPLTITIRGYNGNQSTNTGTEGLSS